MKKTNPKVDWYFNKARKWQEEVNELRTIILASGLTEELKWGHPCYTLNKKGMYRLSSLLNRRAKNSGCKSRRVIFLIERIAFIAVVGKLFSRHDRRFICHESACHDVKLK